MILASNDNEEMPVSTLQAGMIETMIQTSILDEVQKQKIESRLSNMLADHLSVNRELITRAASEGLKRSLANTFNEKEQ